MTAAACYPIDGKGDACECRICIERRSLYGAPELVAGIDAPTSPVSAAAAESHRAKHLDWLRTTIAQYQVIAHGLLAALETERIKVGRLERQVSDLELRARGR